MEEFSVSASFPKLAKGVPVEYQDEVKALVLNILQPICDQTGWTDIILSGYRSPELNEAVGGAGSIKKGGNISQHTIGEAADNLFKDKNGAVPIIDVLKKVVELGLDFDQMIAYPNFVHLSYTKRRKNRRQVLYNKSYTGRRI